MARCVSKTEETQKRGEHLGDSSLGREWPDHADVGGAGAYGLRGRDSGVLLVVARAALSSTVTGHGCDPVTLFVRAGGGQYFVHHCPKEGHRKGQWLKGV